MTQGKPLRVRCPKCEVGAEKNGPGYSIVRTGKVTARKRTFNGESFIILFIELKCEECGYVYESRHPRAKDRPLEEGSHG